MAVEAGWPGLLIGEERGGAGPRRLRRAAGRRGVRAQRWPACRCSGLLPATALLDAAGDESLRGRRRRRAAAGLRSRRVRPGDHERRLDGRCRRGRGARAGAGRARSTATSVTVTGTVACVPDAPGARLLVVVGGTDGAATRSPWRSTAADGVRSRRSRRYDATRSLGHVTLDGATGRRLDVGDARARRRLVSRAGADRRPRRSARCRRRWS